MRTKTRPTIFDLEIGPNTVESFDDCRLSPSTKYEWAGTFTGEKVFEDTPCR